MALISSLISHKCSEQLWVLSKPRLSPMKTTRLVSFFLVAKKARIRFPWKTSMCCTLFASPTPAWSRCWRLKLQPLPKTTAGSMRPRPSPLRRPKSSPLPSQLAPPWAVAPLDLLFSRLCGSATRNSSRSKNRHFPKESFCSQTVTVQGLLLIRIWLYRELKISSHYQ